MRAAACAALVPEIPMFLYGTHPKKRTRDNSQPRFDHEDEAFDQGRYDCNMNWCLYNVLMVEWKNGIAYRIGVGQVHIHAFDTKKNELADRPIRCLEKKEIDVKSFGLYVYRSMPLHRSKI